MRFECEDISGAIKLAATVADKRHGGAYASVMIVAQDNAISVLGCDGRRWVKHTVPGSVTEAGTAYIGADDAARLPSGKCKAFTDGAWLEYEARDFTAKLPTWDGPLPSPPSVDADIEVDADLAHKVSVFCDIASHSTVSHGIAFSGGYAIAGGGTMFAGTPCDATAGKMIPFDAMQAIPKGSRILIGESAWRSEAEGVISHGLMLDASFPDFSAAMPRGEAFAHFSAPQMAKAISASTLGRATEVIVSFAEESMVGQRFVGADAQTCAKLDCHGSGAIVFKAKQLLKACSFFAGEVAVSANNRMALLTDEKSGDICIIGLLRDEKNDIPET